MLEAKLHLLVVSDERLVGWLERGDAMLDHRLYEQGVERSFAADGVAPGTTYCVRAEDCEIIWELEREKEVER